MFLTIDELKDVLYSYQAEEIAEGDEQILENGINAGVNEVKAYFTASNQKQWDDGRPKFDVNKIFGAVGNERDPWILRLCKTVAAWNIIELSNVDYVYEKAKDRYEKAIDTLEKVAGMGDYKGSPTLTPDLPTIDQSSNQGNEPKALFRFGSREKFNHY